MATEHQGVSSGLEIRDPKPVDENTTDGVEEVQEFDHAHESDVMTDGLRHQVNGTHNHERQPR